MRDRKMKILYIYLCIIYHKDYNTHLCLTEYNLIVKLRIKNYEKFVFILHL